MSIWKKYSDVSKAAWLEKISTDLKGKEAADFHKKQADGTLIKPCLLYTSPSPRD